MSPLEHLLNGWWQWIVAASWQVALWIAIVAAVAWLARRASPRVRYALWLLVLVKVFLPPTLAASWGVGTWGLGPAWQRWQSENSLAAVSDGGRHDALALSAAVEESPAAATEARATDFMRPFPVAFTIWLAGCALLLLSAVWEYRRLVRMTRDMELVDEGPLRVELERLALDAQQSRVPELYLTSADVSPFLFGLWRPRIVLPRKIAEQAAAEELRGVLAHELTHWRRRDLWVGWLQVVGQALFWFHPLVWWANVRLRHERECACDEQVLQSGDHDPVTYGQTLLSVLSAVRGKAMFQGNLVGIFEPGANLQQRLEEIMNYRIANTDNAKRWYPLMAVLLLVFLPMAAVTRATDAPAGIEAAAQQAKMPAWIAATNPAIGATGVDPNLKEISVTFDRDMQQVGWSWTGGGEVFPTTPSDAKPYWKDSRTCVLPVELEEGSFYRVGINSTSHHNFRSMADEPVPCTAIYFCTKGATKAVEARVRKPQVVKLVPANGATDVDPETKALRVTFDVPMGEGMSWTGGGETFPKIREGEQAKWSSDDKSCIMPVTLEPGHEYTLGINSLHHINFQSKWGVPADPVRYSFKTAGEAAEPDSGETSATDRHLQELVEDFFDHNFRDVTQRKTIEWGSAEKDSEGNYSIRYKYYASIWDKKLMVMNQVFTFEPDGEFIAWVNVDGFPKTMIGETSIPEDE